MSDLPKFTAWFVGGSPDEGAQLRHQITEQKILRTLLRSGRLMIWGRVDNTSLPELYSRARVAAVPSMREQFGIVALEAQACECPVVASRLGGLQDIVLHSVTGILVPPGDPLSLAFALSTYLRNPYLSMHHGSFARSWVTAAFSWEAVARQYNRLYRDSQPIAAWKCSARVAQQLATTDARKRLTFVLGAEPQDIKLKPLSGISGHKSFQLDFGRRTFFAKFFETKPLAAADRFRLARGFSGFRSKEAMYRAALLHRDNLAAPNLVAHNDQEFMILTEWLPNKPSPTDFVRLSKVLCKQLRHYRRLGRKLLDTTKSTQYLASARAFWRLRSGRSLDAFDYASARLNFMLYPSHSQFFRTHPQIEIIRLDRQFSRSGAGAVFPALSEAVKNARYILCDRVGLLLQVPELSHGDVKFSHLRMRGDTLVIIDPEETHFAVGPLDIGHWAYYAAFREPVESLNGAAAIDLIGELLRNRRNFLLATSWMVAQAAFSALGQTLYGHCDSAESTAQFINEAVRATNYFLSV